MASPAKRQRFDASALSPSDSATTPMATARKSLLTSVTSLQPSIASILSRLGVELLVCLHKLFVKQNQVKKFDDDPEHIPISARVKFSLKTTKLVEQDAEYVRLAGETATIVDTFQKSLRENIFHVTKLEVSSLQKVAVETFATHLQIAVKAALLCEPELPDTDVSKYITTLLSLYGTQLLDPLKITVNAFNQVYCQKHSILQLPAPFVTELPQPGARPPRNITLPPQSILQFLPKLWRTLESTFVIPWLQYLDVHDRNKKDLALKKLNDEFFLAKSTDDTAMLVDAEPPADPQVLQDLIQSKVLQATKNLQKDLDKLKISLAKNNPRDHSGASRKKKSGNGNRGKAAGNSNASVNDRRNNPNSSTPRRSSKKSSNSKRTTSTTRSKK